MSLEIYAEPNDTKNGFKITNEYNRSLFLEWLKKYKALKIIPVIEDSRESRGYLYGAVIPTYCEWQYNIPAREKGKTDTREFLFKRDFNSEIIKDREGKPERVPLSLRGKTRVVLDNYTRWADENGAPVPNPDLYKTYKKEFSMDLRWPTFYDWLNELGIEQDAMPSAETLDQFRSQFIKPDYPVNDLGEVQF